MKTENIHILCLYCKTNSLQNFGNKKAKLGEKVVKKFRCNNCKKNINLNKILKFFVLGYYDDCKQSISLIKLLTINK